MNEKNSVVEKQARGKGARFVYEELKREILTLELEPGTPLDETTISHRFAMSRSPVREALVRLSADGLVTAVGLGIGSHGFNEVLRQIQRPRLSARVFDCVYLNLVEQPHQRARRALNEKR